MKTLIEWWRYCAALSTDRTVFFLVFQSIHDVLKAEKILKKAAASFELVPVPRALSSDCGVCITSKGGGSEIIRLLKRMNVDKCYLSDGSRFVTVELDEGENENCVHGAEEDR